MNTQPHTARPSEHPATLTPARSHDESEVIRERLLAQLPVSERRLTLNRIPTAVLEGGDGAPIVLLHGPNAYGAQWRHVIPSLVTTHRVIAPDLPGHGATSPIDGVPDRDRICGWLDDLIECTCSSRPVLVGHTLGGAIAATFASERSERVSALVLVDTLGLVDFAPAPPFGSALQAYLAAPTGTTHDGLWSQCLANLTTVKRRLGDEWEDIKVYNLATAQMPGRITALTALMEQFGGPAIPPEALSRIAVPTTLIWGRHDRATPLSVAEEASARHGWDLRVIEDAADDPTIEQPAIFLSTLRSVLEG